MNARLMLCYPISHSVENPLLHLHSVFCRSGVYGCDCDLVPELAKGSRQHAGALLLSLRIRFGALLDKSNPLMQDLPRHATEPMGDWPDGGLIAQSRQQTPERCLKMAAFLLYRSVGRLVQHPSQIFIPLRGAAAVVLFGAFVLSRTGSQPRSPLRR